VALENCCLLSLIGSRELLSSLSYWLQRLVVFSLLVVPENCCLFTHIGARELLSSLSFWLQRIVVFSLLLTSENCCLLSPFCSREYLSSLSIGSAPDNICLLYLWAPDNCCLLSHIGSRELLSFLSYWLQCSLPYSDYNFMFLNIWHSKCFSDFCYSYGTVHERPYSSCLYTMYICNALQSTKDLQCNILQNVNLKNYAYS
jgi:hypothetical protein